MNKGSYRTLNCLLRCFLFPRRKNKNIEDIYKLLIKYKDNVKYFITNRNLERSYNEFLQLYEKEEQYYLHPQKILDINKLTGSNSFKIIEAFYGLDEFLIFVVYNTNINIPKEHIIIYNIKTKTIKKLFIKKNGNEELYGNYNTKAFQFTNNNTEPYFFVSASGKIHIYNNAKSKWNIKKELSIKSIQGVTKYKNNIYIAFGRKRHNFNEGYHTLQSGIIKFNLNTYKSEIIVNNKNKDDNSTLNNIPAYSFSSFFISDGLLCSVIREHDNKSYLHRYDLKTKRTLKKIKCLWNNYFSNNNFLLNLEGGYTNNVNSLTIIHSKNTNKYPFGYNTSHNLVYYKNIFYNIINEANYTKPPCLSVLIDDYKYFINLPFFVLYNNGNSLQFYADNIYTMDNNFLYKISKESIDKYISLLCKTPYIYPIKYNRFKEMKFTHKLKCSIKGFNNSIIRFTTNGINPKKDSPIYTKPFIILENTVVKAKVFKKGLYPSNTSIMKYEKIEYNKILYGDWNNDKKDTPAYVAKSKYATSIKYYKDFDGSYLKSQDYGGKNSKNYLTGDWDGDGIDTIGLRRENKFFLNNDWDGTHDILPIYKFDKIDNALSGDFDGNNKDGLAIFADNKWHIDNNLDGKINQEYSAKFANNIDQYFAGDYNGNGKDTIAWRCENRIFIDNDLDGKSDKDFILGTGQEKYISGDWNGDSKDTIIMIND